MVPVIDQIEGHHRRHHDQREDRDQRATARPERLQSRRQPARALRHQIGNAFVGVEASADDLLHPGPARIADHLAQFGDVAGNIVDEGRQLTAEERHHQEDHQDNRQNDHRDDQQRRDHPINAGALKPVGQRRQQIGNEQAGDERQQDFRQQP